MKITKHLAILAVLLTLLLGCSKNEDLLSDIDHAIIGKWKLVEESFSSGGPQQKITIENGDVFVFSPNGTFSSDRFPECTHGTFSIKSNELTVKYECGDFNTGMENSEGVITFKVTFDSDYMLLIPTSVLCIEGCSSKYEKVSSNN